MISFLDLSYEIHDVGLVLSGHELNVHGKEELLQLAADIEGHPDNVAPAIYGSVQLVCKLYAFFVRSVSYMYTIGNLCRRPMA